VVNAATIFYVATTISLVTKGCQKILLILENIWHIRDSNRSKVVDKVTMLPVGRRCGFDWKLNPHLVN
jgi:hypothetical protein